jgi:hypothetical protein
MRSLLVMISLIAIAAGSTNGFAAVKVNFVNPEHYTDVGSLGGRDRVRNLDELERAFQKLGERYLLPGQTLTIDVLDIDLAGRLEPWHVTPNDVRYMREITWPQMKLHYTLESASEPPLQAEETISDRSYLEIPNTNFSERLPYDKRMMERWFKARFVQHRPPHG